MRVCSCQHCDSGKQNDAVKSAAVKQSDAVKIAAVSTVAVGSRMQNDAVTTGPNFEESTK